MLNAKFSDLTNLPVLSPRYGVYAIVALLAVCTSIILLTDYEFDCLLVVALLNIVLLPRLLQQHEQSMNRVEEPADYVRFDDELMHVGTTAVPVVKVNKVALEIVKNDCYFSLPYNPTSPGKCPAFIFAASKQPEFQQYLLSHIKGVEIIR